MTKANANFSFTYDYNGDMLTDSRQEYFDNQISRWLRVDPLADKYPGWSPYNYAINNPLKFLDTDGRDIIVVQAPAGASRFGHTAVLIGNSRTGWTYVSKNGTIGGKEDISGPSDNLIIHGIKNPIEFINKLNTSIEHPYTKAILISANQKTDELMLDAAENQATSDYELVGASCVDVASDALKAGGFDPGNEVQVNSRTGSTIKTQSSIPNKRFQAMKRNNQNKDLSKELNVKREDENDVNIPYMWNGYDSY